MEKTVHFEPQEQVSKVVTPDKGEAVKATTQGKRTDGPSIIPQEQVLHPRVAQDFPSCSNGSAWPACLHRQNASRTPPLTCVGMVISDAHSKLRRLSSSSTNSRKAGVKLKSAHPHMLFSVPFFSASSSLSLHYPDKCSHINTSGHSDDWQARMPRMRHHPEIRQS